MLTALITCFVVTFDLITKYIIKSNMSLGDTIPLIKDVLHITYVENKGAAFSMLADSRWVFMLVTTIAIVGIVAYIAIYSKSLTRLSVVSLSMILGGAIGNMVDRVFNGEILFEGGVVDFIDFRIINFAIFNVADSFVCIGAGLLILSVLLDEVKASRKKAEKSPETESEANE